ncbi:unnamed protein product [Chrysoparadoxa australica]
MEGLPEILDDLWPVVIVFVSMMALCWICSLYLTQKSMDTFLSVYFGGAAVWALKTLWDSGVLGKLLDTFGSLDDGSKYMCSVALIAVGYFLSGAFSSRSKLKEAGGGAESGKPISYPKSLSSDEKKAFVGICDMLMEEVLEDMKETHEAIPEQVEWVKNMLEYNVKGGKMNRGMGVIDVQQVFANQAGRNLSTVEVCRASVLGWCIEWLQAFFLVADDIMDGSITRRDKPCWYRVPSVKLIAINDSFILESFVYQVLRRHFAGESYYLQLVELFHDCVFRTEMGQLLDLTSQPMDGPADLARLFTMTRYKMIVKYKTAFYTFYLPCAIGMITAGVKNPGAFSLARTICCAIGEFFQARAHRHAVQDDYLDCFGVDIGKVGTDIQDNKCSWLVVQALDRCDSAQRKVLVENYGQDDPKKVLKVKELYKTLGLQKAYEEYEQESYETINNLIAQVTDVPREIYDKFINRIYKRTK